MDAGAYRAAVEAAFRSYASGEATIPLPMHIPAGRRLPRQGALVALDRRYAALKLNGTRKSADQWLADDPGCRAALRCDERLASRHDRFHRDHIAKDRSGSALAARYLARDDARSIAICGCGEQGRAQLAALVEVTALTRAVAWDIDVEKARQFAHDAQAAHGFEAVAVPSVREATWGRDIVVTATSAQSPFLAPDRVSPGTFVAAVGADSPHKNELSADLLAGAKVVADVLAQCVVMGDLHHAIEAAGRVRASMSTPSSATS
jgi:hypothetical protein